MFALCSGLRGGGGGGLGSLALGLQRIQRLAPPPGGRSQVWLLLPQLGEQWLEAEIGLSHAQAANRLEQGIGRARFAPASAGRRRSRSHGLTKFEEGA